MTVAVDDFIAAFARYMRTGDTENLTAFCEDPAQRPLLAIYRNGFYKSCVDALKSNFPVCALFLGEKYFAHAARVYVDRHPPRRGTLLGYGEHFPDFLRALREQDPEEWLGMPSPAADVAELDLAWLSSLMSANAQRPLTIEHVARLTEQGEDIACESVKLNPSVKIRDIDNRVFELWVVLKTDAHDHDELPPVFAAESQTVMFWRIQGSVHARELSRPEQALMRELEHTGSQLSTAMNAALTLDPTFDVSDVFSACLQNELLELQIDT